VTATGLVRDALARIVTAREALDYGDTFEAAALLADLEHDLAGALERIEQQEAAR
jgi:hypothetical protein